MIAYLQGRPLTGSTGRPTLEDAVEAIKINTRKFAKAQRTWLKRFRNVGWIDVGPDDSADAVEERVLPWLTEEAP